MPLSRHALAPPLVALGLLLTTGPVHAQDAPPRKLKGPKGETWEQDQYEDRVVHRLVERAAKAADTEGHRWQRELAKAFPGQVGPGLTEDDLTKWFDLLAGGGREWRRAAAPTRQVAELFDRVAQRLDLGPIPSVRRDEFLPFARRHLLAGNPQQPRPGDRHGEADRVFRVLDRDGSGVLEAGEWTERLRADVRKADADGNRRVGADEYRAYLDGRVTEAIEAATKAAAAAKPAPGVERAGGLPAWFQELDTDADGQVGLYEWRAAGRPIAEFVGMDLNADGLLPPDEYLRHARTSEAAGGRAEPGTVPPGSPADRQAGGVKRKP